MRMQGIGRRRILSHASMLSQLPVLLCESDFQKKVAGKMKIGSVLLDNITVLAPLAGITNLPFRLLANGIPVGGIIRSRTAHWQAGGAGFSRLSVIDAAGRSATVNVYLE